MYIGVSVTKGVPREEIGPLSLGLAAGPTEASLSLSPSPFILSYECAQLHLKSCAPLIFTAAAA